MKPILKAGLDIKRSIKTELILLLLAVASDKDLYITNYLISKGLSFKDVDQEGNTLLIMQQEQAILLI